MIPFEERDGAWWFGGVDLHALAAIHGTPTYIYSAAAIRSRIDALQAATDGLDARICYAVKANPNLAVLRLMAQGLGDASIAEALGMSVRSVRRRVAEAIAESGAGSRFALGVEWARGRR